ncbi:uncharacterized protein LOC127124121 [Lathyrus oleraceus]|uniref:C2 NT-type domain-containing protein n=1 Tax=Pisum sativum TaxID=3888 RepID=A0A9D5BGW6_PEA|nr:uncharacterized protein LOC127124121 [Pisum sativum]XP_050910094.1 uncharacterized protein LOC127124121 [Pisum sativum]XP_050910095.1 uncharacterized protein LOC127124121 [Pisum sativum]KAI5443443.1 hypothetical protein KIW84_012185 [Pisum sativum]
MVLGMRGKNMRTSKVQIDYLIHIQEIKPWPPSQSLRSLHSVLIEWKNGSSTLGSTKVVSPSLGSIIGEGRIEFNESFRISVTLLRDVSIRGGDFDVFQKNFLEFNLYEPRKDNKIVKGQLLGNAVIDFADYGVIKEGLSISTSMNCKRSYKNNDQPALFIRIQPLEKIRARSSSLQERFSNEVLENNSNGCDSVSTLMNEEYAEEAEIASFTDGDVVSSHSSVAGASTSLELKNEPNGPIRKTNMVQQDACKKMESSSHMSSSMDTSLSTEKCATSPSLVCENLGENSRIRTRSNGQENFDENFHDKVTHSRNIVEGVQRISSKNTYKINPKEAKNGNLEGKLDYLKKKVKNLEGELREAAAIEASLYSVVAEHGNSMSKVHTPARRLSRLYLHACREKLQGRRYGAAKSSVSGLVLVSKACGNDVPRLTFWLSNTIVLRTIISRNSKDLVVSSNHGGFDRRRKTETNGNGKIASSSQRWKGGKNESTKALGYESFGNWDDPHVFISALEEVEAWIFSRIVESIWWQTLTPHMQHVDTNITNKEVASASRKSYRTISSSCDQDKSNLSLDIWKNALKETFERLCPIRAEGHECGCLPMLPKLIMEQCVVRLDVAMFNAILRESDDEIPTDPVSDAISDPKVLPIPPGKSSFGAGAQLKTVIGKWSRWLSDLYGMNEEDSIENNDGSNNNEQKKHKSFNSFTLLNSLSDLLMLPKDMLLCASIRSEVCPMFTAPLIKRILDNFFPDEFCPDQVPITVFEALDLENDMEHGKELDNNFPYSAAPISYLPPTVTSVASILGEVGSKSQLRNKSSVVRKSYTSDDELNELKSPLSSILFNDSSSSSEVLNKSNLMSKEICSESPVRYDLLRDVWMSSN